MAPNTSSDGPQTPAGVRCATTNRSVAPLGFDHTAVNSPFGPAAMIGSSTSVIPAAESVRTPPPQPSSAVHVAVRTLALTPAWARDQMTATTPVGVTVA